MKPTVRCLLLAVPLFLLGGFRAFSQERTNEPRPIFGFVSPRIILSDHQKRRDENLFSGLEFTGVLPLTHHDSLAATARVFLTGQFGVLSRGGLKNKTVTGSLVWNHDYLLGEDTVLRFSLGRQHSGGRLVRGVVYHRLTPHLGFRAAVQNTRLGTEVFAGFATPLVWGKTWNNKVAKRSPRWGQLPGKKVSSVGATTVLNYSWQAGVDNTTVKNPLYTESDYFFLPAFDWPRAGHDVQGAGFTAQRFKLPLHHVWTFQTRGALAASPAIVDDTVYAGAGDGLLYAVDVKTGEERWRFQTGAPINSPPAVAARRVYFGCTNNSLYCVATEDPVRRGDLNFGRLKWRYRTAKPVSGSPLVTNSGKVVFASADGTVHCANMWDGSVLWQKEAGAPVVASIVKFSPELMGRLRRPRAPNLLFVATTAGELIALNDSGGAEVWAAQVGGPITAAPVVVQDRVYVATQSGRVAAYNVLTGDLLWSFDADGAIEAAPASAEHRLLVAGTTGVLWALDRHTGEVLWQARPGDRLTAAPCLPRDDWAFVGSTNGRLYALDRKKGAVKWDFATNGPITAGCALGRRTLVVASQDGALYAFREGRSKKPPREIAAEEQPPPKRKRRRRRKADQPSLQPPQPFTAPSTAPSAASQNPPAQEQPHTKRPSKPAPTRGSEQKSLLYRVDATAPPAVPPCPSVRSLEQGKPLTGADVQMILLTSLPGSDEPPVELVDRPRVRFAGTVQDDTAVAGVSVDGRAARLSGGRFELVREFADEGAYRVTFVATDAAGNTSSVQRMVVVSTQEPPIASGAVVFSPNADGRNDQVSFTIAVPWNAVAIAKRVLEIRDLRGRTIRAWQDTEAAPASYTWDGTDFAQNRTPPGLYVAVFAVCDRYGRVREMYQPVRLEQ